MESGLRWYFAYQCNPILVPYILPLFLPHGLHRDCALGLMFVELLRTDVSRTNVLWNWRVGPGISEIGMDVCWNWGLAQNCNTVIGLWKDCKMSSGLQWDFIESAIPLQSSVLHGIAKDCARIAGHRVVAIRSARIACNLRTYQDFGSIFWSSCNPLRFCNLVTIQLQDCICVGIAVKIALDCAWLGILVQSSLIVPRFGMGCVIRGPIKIRRPFGWIETGLWMDCIESTIPSQSPGLQKIVPALPGFWLDRVVVPDRLQFRDNLERLACDLWISQDFNAILWSPGNPSRFWYFVAIQLDCTGSWMDCPESAIQPQSPGLQNIVSEVPGFWKSLRGSIWSSRLWSQPMAFGCNPCQLCQDCTQLAIKVQSSDLWRGGPDCGRIAMDRGGPCWGSPVQAAIRRWSQFRAIWYNQSAIC